MKTTIIGICFILGWFAVSFTSGSFLHKDGQVKPDGKDTIKLVISVNGKTVVIDTALTLNGDINFDLLDDILKSNGIDVKGINGEKGMRRKLITVKGDDMNKNMKIQCLNGDTSMIDFIKCGSMGLDSLDMGCSKIMCKVVCDDKDGKKQKKAIVKTFIGDNEIRTSDKDEEIRIELNENGDVKTFTINGKDAKSENLDTDVKVINCDKGQKMIIIQAKIRIDDLNEKDIQILEKKDIIHSAGTEQLKVDQLNFYPNPNNGKFNLSFSLPDNGKTVVKIFDANGKEVYKESLPDFKGKYNNNINISGEARGLYFLNIEQGNKVINKKLIIE